MLPITTSIWRWSTWQDGWVRADYGPADTAPLRLRDLQGRLMARVLGTTFRIAQRCPRSRPVMT